MAAIRIIDDHLELANIGTNTHAQIDTHIAAADDYVKRDGSLALTADWDIGDTRKIHADEIRARDGAGLKLYDDGGNGIFVKDGGNVGIGTEYPTDKLSVSGGRFVLKGSDGAATQFKVYAWSDTNWHSADFLFYRSRGTAASNTTVVNGDRLFSFNLWAYDGANYVRGAEFGGFVDGSVSTGIVPSKWTYKTMDASGVLNTVLTLKHDGNVGIFTTSPTAKLDINSDILRLRTAKTPATAGAAGNQGDICWDANYIYICTATNSWKRAAIAAW